MRTVSQLQTLTAAEVSLVTGGLGPIPVPPPVWKHKPPPRNPGGPILITCIVGKGCMTEPA